MIREAILWMGGCFSPEQYLFWTRIQCIAWTAADVVIVFYMLRLANLARCTLGEPLHRWPYFVLGATLLPLPGVVLASGGWAVFGIELLVTVPHFCLIVYVLAVNMRLTAAFLQRLLGGAPSP